MLSDATDKPVVTTNASRFKMAPISQWRLSAYLGTKWNFFTPATLTIRQPSTTMATATLTPTAIPSTNTHSAAAVPRSAPAQMSILDEVRASQHHLRTRLAGAITKPPPGVSPAALPNVPLIDLSASFSGTLEARKQVASDIRQACLTTGFFQISNHGITTSAMEGILKQSHRYFHEQTTEQKYAMHIKDSPLFRGYEPGDYTYTNPDDTDAPFNEAPIGASSETKEGFNWGYEPSLDPSGGDGKYVELDGSTPDPSKGEGNVWPPESQLPGFKLAVRDYYAQVLALARHLFRLFALSLNLEETYFDDLTTHPGGIGRLLSYPAQPPSTSKTEEEREAESKLGLGAHTDYECFTLLLASNNPGLEILFPPSELTNGKPIWRPCPIRPGTLTVNVADFLMRWTNGVYKSTIHRVVSKAGDAERYSVPFFFSINYDSEVTPLPEAAVGPSKYKPMAVGTYVLERLKATKAEGELKDDVGKPMVDAVGQA